MHTVMFHFLSYLSIGPIGPHYSSGPCSSMGLYSTTGLHSRTSPHSPVDLWSTTGPHSATGSNSSTDLHSTTGSHSQTCSHYPADILSTTSPIALLVPVFQLVSTPLLVPILLHCSTCPPFACIYQTIKNHYRSIYCNYIWYLRYFSVKYKGL